VDDSPTQLELFKSVLEENGFQVQTARNGLEAIQHIFESPPLLVISDILMPELNGYHLCRLVKDDPRMASIPIILLTNLKEPHDRFWGEKAGADLYIEKSSDFTPIIEAIRSLLPTVPPATRDFLTSGKTETPDIRNRITDILDRLLYESTISNEILKLTALAHDVEGLSEELLRFLAVIIRYDLAGLLIREGHEKYLLVLQAIGPVCKSSLEDAKAMIITNLDLGPRSQLRVQHIHTNCENLTEEAPPLKILQTIRVEDKGELLALVTLFDAKPHPLSERTKRALDVLTDRLLIVGRYLKKIKDIEEVKADFVSMLVHDMRTPLTSIKGFTDILADGILGKVSDDQLGALANIRSSSERLLNLIGDILDLSKLEAGKMEIQVLPFNILPLARQVVKDLSSLFKDKDLAVTLSIPEDLPYVMGDGKQVVRVLINLLNNAVKFTPNGSQITIAAESLPPTSSDINGSLRINISDEGPGIPEDQQKKLFERYQQIHPSGVFRKGTGLGLAICKEIVTLHGGRIWLESPLNKKGGSRFSFTLPLAPTD